MLAVFHPPGLIQIKWRPRTETNTNREAGLVHLIGAQLERHRVKCERHFGQQIACRAASSESRTSHFRRAQLTVLWRREGLRYTGDVTSRTPSRNRKQRARAAAPRRDDDPRLNAIIDSAMDAIITVDEVQNILLFNAAAEKIFHCAAADAVGRPLDRFIPERFRAAHRSHVKRFGETGETTRMMGSRLALWGLRADGEEFPIDASISQVTANGRKLYTVILRDITERKRAEEALERSYQDLRQLSAAMHEVREAERLRVARELHDELAQWLTAIKMDVSWIASRLPPEQQQLADRVERLKGVVDTTVASVRRIASDLRPVMLDDLGLVAALENLLHEMSQRTGIVMSLDADERALDYGEPLTSSLYRMAQEALTNVTRHAGATEAQVAIAVDSDRLVLTVRDNGRGYDAEVAGRRKSYGVLGIRERAYTLGGAARIERMETGGTLVEIVIPVARYRRRQRDTGIAG